MSVTVEGDVTIKISSFFAWVLSNGGGLFLVLDQPLECWWLY
jgi:hypothetical protein